MYEWKKSEIEFVKLPEVELIADSSNRIKVTKTQKTWVRLDCITKFYAITPTITMIKPFGSFQVSIDKLISLLEGKVDS